MIKKILKFIIEYSVVFIILTLFCFYINKNIVMKALYMDDLYHWSWFRGLNLFDFAFKFYESSRYRPVFETIQYMIYILVDTDPTRLVFINKIYNSLIALFIYYFIKKLDVNRIVALIFSLLYLVAHFSYYQICQGIGSLESTALLLSLIILYICLKLSGGILKIKDDVSKVSPTNLQLNFYIFYIFIIYFMVSFTHERFMCLAVPILISIMMSKDNNKYLLSKRKVISVILFLIEIAIICYIRYLAIGKVLPAGTGGTYVEDTFNLSTCINYCFTQVLFILGINNGPEHLVGIEFANVESQLKIATIISIIIIILIIFIYIFARINNTIKKYKLKQDISKRNYFACDLLFLSFIAMCIGASSVTIRIEMRFVYVSFTAAIIFLSYMYSAITEIFSNKIIKAVVTILVFLVVIFRLPIELKYRSMYQNIYCFENLKKINSIYDCTIGKYGLDDILNNKKIYLINKYYDMNEFYAEYLLKIYDKNNIGKKIIMVNDISEIPLLDINDNTIILYEDLENYQYNQLKYE